MSKDRSLDDFAGDVVKEPQNDDEGGSTQVDDAEESQESQESQEGERDQRVERVEPATPTYRFAPDGAACDACDEVVQKRWHDEGQFVCADCKAW